MLVRVHRYPTVPAASVLNVAPVFDRLFDDIAGTSRKTFTRNYPALDVVENDNEYTLIAELPGVAKEDVKISLNEDTLTISGNRKAASLRENSASLRTETAKGEFSRSVTFPGAIQPEKITAELKNGILTVVLPKTEEVRPREISIR